MKKIILAIAAIAMSLGASADTLKYFMGEKELELDGTYTFTGFQFESFGDDMGQIIINPELSILSDTSSEVNITATCKTGERFQMCAGSQCVEDVVVTKKNIPVVAGEKLPLELEYMTIGRIADITPIEIEISTKFVNVLGFSTDNVTIILNPDINAVQVIENNHDFVVANNILKYNIEENVNLCIYNSDGRIVMQRSLYGAGEIDLSYLNKGVYIYKVDGTQSKSGKFMIK